MVVKGVPQMTYEGFYSGTEKNELTKIKFNELNFNFNKSKLYQ